MATGQQQKRHGRARTWAGVGRDIWADPWLVLGALATFGFTGIFYRASSDIVGGIIAGDPVYFAGLSATFAVFVGQASFVRFRSIRRERQDNAATIMNTADPELLDKMKQRIASVIDTLEVDRQPEGAGPLDAALQRWHDRRLRQFSVFRELAVLRRNLDAAYERANDYFDAQAEDEEFHTDADQFHVIISDINQACGNALRIDTALTRGRHLDGTARRRLDTIRLNGLGNILRDLTEALERRNHVFESLFRDSNGDESLGRAREYFRVMTSDLRKAHRTLESLINRDRFNARLTEFIKEDGIDVDESAERLIDQQYRTVQAYVNAASSRAQEVMSEIASGSHKAPPILNVLEQDISSAADRLRVDWRSLSRELKENLGTTAAGPEEPHG